MDLRTRIVKLKARSPDLKASSFNFRTGKLYFVTQNVESKERSLCIPNISLTTVPKSV
ncbi:hypothetical protein JYQ62_15550 [Nostoc sp. UHCC 0702]|nr:hypothetical protein JYQ62_15550 [Nostoc sp. UHCC 0702]